MKTMFKRIKANIIYSNNGFLQTKKQIDLRLFLGGFSKITG